MCKSITEGGQRCAAHTRPAYEATPRTDPKWDDVAAAYASTREGHERLTQELADAKAAGLSTKIAQLRNALTRGETMREANGAAKDAIARADLSNRAPDDIDGELARIYGEVGTAQSRRDSDFAYLAKDVARYVLNRSHWGATATPTEVENAVRGIEATTPEADRDFRIKGIIDRHDRLARMDENIAALEAQMVPFNREFERRGGWNRAFLVVTNGTGHVHRNMACSTCRPTTRYHWVTEMSDKTEPEIVQAAGDRACTVCYSSAPVEDRNRPTTLFTPEERTQQASRVDRATAAQEKQAKKIANALTADGSEFKVECTRFGYAQKESFKTERSATTWMVSNMADFHPDGYLLSDRTMDESMSQAHETIIEAIAAKHGKTVDEVKADIVKKVDAKLKRDRRA